MSVDTTLILTYFRLIKRYDLYEQKTLKKKLKKTMNYYLCTDKSQIRFKINLSFFFFLIK